MGMVLVQIQLGNIGVVQERRHVQCYCIASKRVDVDFWQDIWEFIEGTCGECG